MKDFFAFYFLPFAFWPVGLFVMSKTIAAWVLWKEAERLRGAALVLSVMGGEKIYYWCRHGHQHELDDAIDCDARGVTGITAP